MNKAKNKAIVLLGILGFLAAPGVLVAQQPGQPSVAEAARKTRARQKKAPKATVVWTNDNIPTAPGSISVVGEPPPPRGAKPAAKAVTPAKKENVAAKRAKLEASLAHAKAALKSLQTDLNIRERKYKLDAAQYYGTPEYSANRQGQANLDAEKAQIASQRQDVDAAQQKVAGLEKQLDALKEKESSSTKPQ